MKDFYDLYDDLFDQANGINQSNEDDSEEFITGAELAKMNNNPNFDINAPKGVNKDDIEESVHFKRYSKRREHKFTEKEMEEIRNSCRNTIVHDYSEHDIYHMSDEEREKADSLRSISMKVASLKRIYRKPDQYIEAMRIYVDAWQVLEKEENFLYSKSEFFKMVHDGRIYSNRLIKPELKGATKIDDETLILYLSNPQLDSKDFVIKQEKVYDDWSGWDDEEDDETEEEKMQRLLSPEEIEWLTKYSDNPPPIEVKPIKKKYIKSYLSGEYNKRGRKKKKNKMSKYEKYSMKNLHTLLRKIESNPNNRDYSQRSHMLTNSMFVLPEREKTFWDDLFYDGSWADKYGCELFDIYVNELIMEQRIPGSTYITYGDRSLSLIFKDLEESGNNVLNLRRVMNKDVEYRQDEEVRESKKKNLKREKAIYNRILNLTQSDKFKKTVEKVNKKAEIENNRRN